jgi:hypothetical protein
MENKDKLDEEIKKLQDALDNHKLQLEEKDEIIKTQGEEFKSKLEELEAKISTKDTEIAEVSNEKQTLEDKFVKLSDEFIEFRKQAELDKKKPVIDELYELEKDDDLLEIYPGWELKKLENRRDRKKLEAEQKAATVITRTLDEEKAAMMTQLETKDVGAAALRKMDVEDRKMAEAIYEEMKKNGEL